jgi:ADP-ribose pyrophosphatase YjhB (NUDIX family)
MSHFCPPKSSIHILARGMVTRGDAIVLCRVKGSDHFFLPGGHVENGESVREALSRELQEEMGEDDYQIQNCIGIGENIFLHEADILKHEINFVFHVLVPEDVPIQAKEDHIEFVIVPQSEFGKYKILPEQIKKGLEKWLDTGKPFFKEIYG